MKKVQLKALPAIHEVSPLLYGIFLEDINFACDGGLSSNQIANHSFDGEYLESSADQMMLIQTKKRPSTVKEPLRYWKLTGGELESRREDGASEKNPFYASVTSDGRAVLTNRGHDGRQTHLGECSISILKGHEYHFSCFARKKDFNGTVTVQITRDSGEALTCAQPLSLSQEWGHTELFLRGEADGYGQLTITFEGKGRVDLDCVAFEDCDVWGESDPKWSGGHFRRDLVEALQALKPSFLRFPGGCIVEGLYRGNEYQWKHTVGSLVDRIPAVNLWGATFAEKGYSQSYQIGFYEYFLLCEDLHMEPLPIVWAGLNCQFRSTESLDTDSPAFEEDVVQNALDLIEYANGDPSRSPWAKLRAESGHPAPFGLKMIGIGNENYGSDYHQKFRRVKEAIQARYPEITCVMSSGAFPQGPDFEETWKIAKTEFPDVLIDEHFYSSNDWVYSQTNRYDSYERGTARVFLGEYAANDVTTPHKANTFGSALAEAAFLTGIERNSDVVAMTCYAPLFSMVDGMHWNHNLIWFNQQTCLRTPNYYVQQLFGAYLGNRYLPLESTLPEKMFASLTEDDRTYYLKLVNASEETVRFSVGLPQARDGMSRRFLLQSRNPDAVNVLEFSGEPLYTVVPQELETQISNGMLDSVLEPGSICVWSIEKKQNN